MFPELGYLEWFVTKYRDVRVLTARMSIRQVILVTMLLVQMIGFALWNSNRLIVWFSSLSLCHSLLWLSLLIDASHTFYTMTWLSFMRRGKSSDSVAESAVLINLDGFEWSAIDDRPFEWMKLCDTKSNRVFHFVHEDWSADRTFYFKVWSNHSHCRHQ